MHPESSIFVAGSETLVGSAILRKLAAMGMKRVATDTHTIDTRRPQELQSYFTQIQPRYVIDAGGKSGGIAANQKFPADLMVDNLVRSTNLIYAANLHGGVKLLYLASSCSYPKACRQPMAIDSLLTGPLEPTNESYAVAKIAGIKLCQAYRKQYQHDFIVGIPANPFGVDDDFSLEDSHVIGTLIRRIHEAKKRGDAEVKVWGTGTPRREFIFADDLADAALFVLKNYSSLQPINLGLGTAMSIRELAEQIQRMIDYRGRLFFDASYPDGIPEKSVDSSALTQMGWLPNVPFDVALNLTYQSFLKQMPP